MDQAAFKALVAGAGRTFEDVAPAGKSEAEKAARKEAKAKKAAKYKQSKGDGGAGTGASSGYRDRAAERRQGSEAQAAEEVLYASVDVAKSKYLGGDEQHTHLVKGLDKVLADRNRKSMPAPASSAPAVPTQGPSHLAAPAAVAGLGGFGTLHAAAAGAAAAVLRGDAGAGTFRTPMARALASLVVSPAFTAAHSSVYGGGQAGAASTAPTPGREGLSGGVAAALSTALGLTPSGGGDRWAQGRHTLTYSLGWDGDAGVPTTLLRSAGDCPPPKRGIVDVIDPRVRSTLLLGLAGKSVPPPTLPSLPSKVVGQPAPGGAVQGGGGGDEDSDDDIFGNAPAYAPLADMVGPPPAGGEDVEEDAEEGGDAAAAEAAFKSAYAPAVAEEGEEEDLTDTAGRLRGLSTNAAALGDAGYGYGEVFSGGIGDGPEEEEEEEGGGRKRRRDVSEAEAARRDERKASQKAASRFEKEFATVTHLMESKAKKARKG